eukprot:5573783-Lingulodinium_polyedra.AAC.1
MAERLPCAKCKGVFLTHWFCELTLDTCEFYWPATEEAEHVARNHRGEGELSVGAAQTLAGRPDTFRC